MGTLGVQYLLFISDKEWIHRAKGSSGCAPHVLLTGHKDILLQRQCCGKAQGS